MSGKQSHLRTEFLARPIDYDGRQLRSHFVLDETGIYGDAAIAFVGECRVDLTEMVDIEDVRAKEPIYSPRMLHVLVEHFDLSLTEGVLRQRILVGLASQLLLEKSGIAGRVKGDDLFVSGRKASVSIATRTPVSVVIHFGINILTDGTPIPTWGLAEAELGPEEFGTELVRRYEGEIDDIHRAVSKVRGVP